MSNARPSSPSTGRRPPRRPGAWLVAAFLLVPVVELAIAIQVGQWIGVWPTVGLLLLEGFIGAAIVRRQGAAAWRALTTSVQAGRPPSTELADAALVLVGGTLLLAPGFLTDIAGFLLVIPVTRRPARRLLAGWAARSLARRVAVRFGPGSPLSGAGPAGPGYVVTGEVVEEPPRERPPL